MGVCCKRMKNSECWERLDGLSCKQGQESEFKESRNGTTPVKRNGRLEVRGLSIVNEYGEPVILRGISTHGLHWEGMASFVSKKGFQTLRDDWGVDLIRLVCYVTQNGYTHGKKEFYDQVIERGVEYASELGMYVMIDWHIHEENPNSFLEEAKEFFGNYSLKYKEYTNILYEICNEPTDTPWPKIKQYAIPVIEEIRRNDKKAIVVVGTNTWAQDVEEVGRNGGRIQGENIMYALHFYSGSHNEALREKARIALSEGTPIYCSEFGVCHASGDQGVDLEEANCWIDFLEENKISYTCWSLCNKPESASLLLPHCRKKYDWSEEDLSVAGRWLLHRYRCNATTI